MLDRQPRDLLNRLCNGNRSTLGQSQAHERGAPARSARRRRLDRIRLGCWLVSEVRWQLSQYGSEVGEPVFLFLEGVAGQAGDRGVRVETPGIGVVSLAVIVGQSLGDLLEIVTRVTMVPSEFFNRSSDSRPRNKSFSNRSTTDLGIIIPTDSRTQQPRSIFRTSSRDRAPARKMMTPDQQSVTSSG